MQFVGLHLHPTLFSAFDRSHLSINESTVLIPAPSPGRGDRLSSQARLSKFHLDRIASLTSSLASCSFWHHSNSHWLTSSLEMSSKVFHCPPYRALHSSHVQTFFAD